MMNKHLNVLMISSLLAACGGGGSGGSGSGGTTPEPGVLTGSFVDSPVKGLYYETETRSGLTNEDGEYEYMAGETVTFKIGSITLGATRAAPVVTPFSLAGITPIAQEAEIVSALSTIKPNSYDRVLNIATLLQALDKDGDPENGIDLDSAHSTLDDENVNLFVKAADFTRQSALADIRRKLDIAHRTSLNESVQHMYRSLGIQIESAQVESITTEINNEIIETVSFEYDGEGNVLLENVDTDNDGTPDNSKEFEYDNQGNVTRIENSANSTVETMDYDDNNNIVNRSIDKPNSDNDIEETYSYVSNLLVEVEIQTGSGSRSVTQYDYTSSGNVKSYESDVNGDGVSDSTAEYEYYADGEVASYIQDSDNDETPDHITVYTYDANGNRSSHSIDIDQDGVPNSISAFAYDENNNVIRYEQDQDNDGNPDYIEDYKYNNNNQRIEYRRDNDADGAWDMVAQYSYDINGNRTRMIEDSDGNGIVDKIWQAEYQAVIFEEEYDWESIFSQL